MEMVGTRRRIDRAERGGGWWEEGGGGCVEGEHVVIGKVEG